MFPAQRPVGARRSHLCFGLDGIDGRASRRFEGYGDLHDCLCHHLVAGLRPTASIHSGRIVATNAATMVRWLSSRWPGYCLGHGRRHPPRGLLFAPRMLLPSRRRAKTTTQQARQASPSQGGTRVGMNPSARASLCPAGCSPLSWCRHASRYLHSDARGQAARAAVPTPARASCYAAVCVACYNGAAARGCSHS